MKATDEAGERLARTYSIWLRALAYTAHITFALVGRINADEGAYLQAARLVARGDIPYRDFAFTQMPLLPYVHALPQAIFGPSLVVGRVTAVGFAIATIAFGVDAARRLAGHRASAVAATLFTAFTLGAYMTAIVKTHSVAAFFVVLALWVLTTSLTDEIRLPLATLFGSFAALTRLSCALFAIAVLVLAMRDRRSRSASLALGAAVGTIALAFFATNPEGALWGLRDFHYDQWAETGAAKVGEIITDRFPGVVLVLGPLAALVFITWRDTRYVRAGTLVRVFGVGTIAYVIPHLATGQWHNEYLVPVVMVLIPIVAATVTAQSARWRAVATAAVAATMLMQGVRFIDIDDGRLPLSRADEVARVVAFHAAPGQRVFALGGLWAVVEADREAVFGTQLLSDGVTVTSPERAARLRVLTPDALIALVAAGEIPVIVLTPIDGYAVWQKGGTDALGRFNETLTRHYDLAFRVEGVGQTDGATDVYVLSPSRAP